MDHPKPGSRKLRSIKGSAEKILIVSDAWHPQVNGVVRTYEHLGKQLEGAGHDVQVIGPANFPFSLPMPGYAEIRLVLRPYRRLTALIAAYDPDHIHIATEGPLGWAARRYCQIQGCAFTTSYHTQFPEYAAKRAAWFVPPLYKVVLQRVRLWVRSFHAPASAVMVATPGLEKDLRSWGFDMPMVQVSRGVDCDLFRPGKKTLFQDLKRPVALCVSRVAIEKNIAAFLDMDWPGSKVLVGSGPLLKSLSRAYPEVHFTGPKVGEDLAAHYRSADLFVFPSRTDTFGIVIIEALASGLPVAAYEVTGPRDIITHPFLGVLDDEDLGRAARKALENGTSEERAAYTRRMYTWENAAAQFESALKLAPLPRRAGR
ncbi:MAG: glycosyltransferase family 1 protein [Alphaproteobacteria bacterium]|nr:glycosyltransferase family 1 protein [Alphaproteobacteria bacterium]